MNNCSERPHSAAASQQIRPRCARLLAKPEYSSPPNEVCGWTGRRDGKPSGRCGWQGRRGRADGRECHGKEDGGTVAESYREDTAGRGTVGNYGRHRRPWTPWKTMCAIEDHDVVEEHGRPYHREEGLRPKAR